MLFPDLKSQITSIEQLASFKGREVQFLSIPSSDYIFPEPNRFNHLSSSVFPCSVIVGDIFKHKKKIWYSFVQDTKTGLFIVIELYNVIENRFNYNCVISDERDIEIINEALKDRPKLKGHDEIAELCNVYYIGYKDRKEYFSNPERDNQDTDYEII